MQREQAKAYFLKRLHHSREDLQEKAHQLLPLDYGEGAHKATLHQASPPLDHPKDTTKNTSVCSIYRQLVPLMREERGWNVVTQN